MNAKEDRDSFSPLGNFWKRFKRDKPALLGLAGITVLLLLALTAPLIANGRPFLVIGQESISSPALYFFFSPDSSEAVIEKIFNYFLIFIPFSAVIFFIFRRVSFKWLLIAIAAILLLIPFIIFGKRLDKTDYRKLYSQDNKTVLFAPVPYGPYENVSKPYLPPSFKHICGTDQIGRDVFSRMLYGARVSLAVGFLATGLALIIGVLVGMAAGYFGGTWDMVIMRIVEIVICFPTFLLLLILMSILMDYNFGHSILIVILVIGGTGWTGLSRLVRGEVLKQRVMPYIRSCEALGLPVWKIMLKHLLPNVTAPIFISFTFGVAGAILTESGLSFLGFGVQEPTASWGELLRQAFSDPFTYWNLILWPGLALFLTLCAFNFTGEGLRKALDPKS